MHGDPAMLGVPNDDWRGAEQKYQQRQPRAGPAQMFPGGGREGERS